MIEATKNEQAKKDGQTNKISDKIIEVKAEERKKRELLFPLPVSRNDKDVPRIFI
jgi:hypothetical protein